MSGSEFYNPYHFIPVTGKVNDKENLVDYDVIKEGADTESSVRHDLWHKNGNSGFMMCHLITESPSFVGAHRVKDAKMHSPALVSHYTRENQPAIPGNTLRGLIGTTIETLSQSALRVLTERPKSGQDHPWSMRIPANGKTKRVQIKKSVHEYFSRISSNLPPWGCGERSGLTIAELMLGCAEDLKNEKSEGVASSARNLASRVRFYDAVIDKIDTPPGLLEDPWHGRPVTLRILASPKPPCPNFYFQWRNRPLHALTKKELHDESSTNAIVPSGRKYYLHHSSEQISDEPWKTRFPDKDLKQKVQITPVAAGIRFGFKVRFDNLTKAELTLLIRALVPSEAYRHRMGMGKSLGLGTVKIEIDQVQLKDRKQAYCLQALKDKSCYTRMLTKLENSDFPFDEQLVDEDTLTILNTLGDPGNLKEGVEVRPPMTMSQVSNDRYEEKGYEWFVKNDNAKGENRQSLMPIEPGQPLPTLESDFGAVRDKKAAASSQKTSNTLSMTPWLKEAVDQVRKMPGQGNLEDADIIRSGPIAKLWDTIEDPDLRASELASILSLCKQHVSGEPASKAKKIYGTK